MTDSNTGAAAADATYTGRITTGIYLSHNPATIAAGAYVTNAAGPDAIFGAAGTAWDVVNHGIVNGGAAGTGIFLDQGGTVANGVGAQIAGGVSAVSIDNAAGYVTNFGTISGGSVGVYLIAGGSVANQASSVIYGTTLGIAIATGNATVANAGRITADGAQSSGIYLRAGGYAAIAATGYVAGVGQAIVVADGAGTIVNQGILTSDAGDGVNLNAGGSLGNAAGAQIYGYQLGVEIAGGAGTVSNYGTIAGGTNNGIYLQAGGSVTNGQTGLITAGAKAIGIAGGDATIVNYGTIIGFFGVYIDPGAAGQATVVNAGTIIGTTGQAIRFAEGNDLLVVEPGAVFVGGIAGAGTSSIELTAGSQTGTLSGFGTTITGFASLTVDAGATWQLDGDAHIISFTNDGTIIVASNDAMVFGAVGEERGAHGVIDLDRGATATFDAAVARGQKVKFVGRDSTLVLDDARQFAARIVAFKAGDTIDLADTKANHLSYRHGVLTLTEHGRTVATLHLAGHYKASEFVLSSDGTGGTDITLSGGGAGIADLVPYGSDPSPPFWLMRS